MAGGAGLIGIPFLIFMGLPPQVAVATHKLGGVGLSIGGFVRFIKSEEIVWPYVLRLSILAFIGSFTGAQLLITINDQWLKYIILVILIVLLPVVLLQRNLGVVPARKSKSWANSGLVLYGLVAIWAGFIGAGSGTMIFYIMMLFFGFTINQSSATQKIPAFVSTATSLIVFIIHGIVNWQVGLTFFGGMMVGGYLGAALALKIGNAWVKIIFTFIVIALTVKLMVEM